MKKLISVFFVMCALLLASCSGDTSPDAAATPIVPDPPTEEARTRPTVDREGFAITLPDEIDTIISIGPVITEVLVALELSDKIIAADRFSDDVVGLAEGIAVLDMMAIDAEYLIELSPDIILVTGMTRTSEDDDPMHMVSNAGITVVYVPVSVSIDAIVEDIRFIAQVMDLHEAGEAIISDMQADLDAIREIAATITAARTVYFEVSPAPTMWSLGANTFINEMIELVGAINIFADEDGWISVADETLLEVNPDVIITSIDFLDDPVSEIMDRPGWGAIAAVQNGDVFQVSANYTSRANHNIVRGLWEIAIAVYPDYFNEN